MRFTITLAALILLGAGCAGSAPEVFVDDTPGSNPENCVASGGSVVEGICECPDGYFPDPADFCLDSAGVPGGNQDER